MPLFVAAYVIRLTCAPQCYCTENLIVAAQARAFLLFIVVCCSLSTHAALTPPPQSSARGIRPVDALCGMRFWQWSREPTHKLTDNDQIGASSRL